MSGKKSFIAYKNWKSTFDELSNEDAGKLIKHIFEYVNGSNEKADTVLIRAVFANIKDTIDRDIVKWEEQIKQRKAAGKRSAEARKSTSVKRSSTSVNETQRNSTDSVNVSVTDSENDNESVNENGNGNEAPPLKEMESFIPTKETFMTAAKEIATKNKYKLDERKVALKFEAWRDAGWRDGNGKEIRNWRNKILHSLPHWEVKQNPTDAPKTVSAPPPMPEHLR